MTKIFYRNAHAVILCYSVGDRGSFDNLKTWMTEIKTSCAENTLVCLSGNKADLPDSLRQVSREMAERFTTDNGLIFNTEASAKNGQNVLELFINISKFLYLKRQSDNERTNSVLGSERTTSVLSRNI